MVGKLREGEFFVGNRQPLDVPEQGKLVTIVDKEEHHIFGTRYKIEGNDIWFEPNCFEYVIE